MINKVFKKVIVLVVMFIIAIFSFGIVSEAYTDEEKQNFTSDQIMSYIQSEYGITDNAGTSGGYVYSVDNKISESSDVLNSWKRTLSQNGYRIDTSNREGDAVLNALYNNSEVSNNKEEEEDDSGGLSGGFSGGSGIPSNESSGGRSGGPSNTTTGTNTGSSTNNTPQSIDDVINGANNFINNANTSGTILQDPTTEAINLIYNVLLAIGLVIAVICGVILGIQFMTSSTDGQAKVKEKLIPYTVGCVIIFGAFGIWKLVMVLLQGF